MNVLRFGSRLQTGLPSRPTLTRAQNVPRPVSPIGKPLFANSANVTPTNSERSFATETNKQAKPIPIAHFPAETLLSGKGYTINPPKKEDKSAIVGFVTIPKAHKELPSEEVMEFGLQKMYKSTNSNIGSVYTVNFDDSSPKMSMENYIRDRQHRFNDSYPDGKFHTVELDPIVTDHLTKKNSVKCTAMLFDPNGGPYSDPMGKLVLYIKTPGGFWDIAWHTSISALHDPKQNVNFTEAIKHLKIVWKDEGESSKEESTVNKVTTVTKKSLIR